MFTRHLAIHIQLQLCLSLLKKKKKKNEMIFQSEKDQNHFLPNLEP